MTGALWKSAFVAAFCPPSPACGIRRLDCRTKRCPERFLLDAHPLSLCLLWKTPRKKYLLVLLAFVCALMSKPMVVTLPVVMILPDYWPLKRFESNKNTLAMATQRKWLPLCPLRGLSYDHLLCPRRNGNAA